MSPEGKAILARIKLACADQGAELRIQLRMLEQAGLVRDADRLGNVIRLLARWTGYES